MKLNTIQEIKVALTNYFGNLDAAGVKTKDYSKQDRALYSASMAIDVCQEELEKFQKNFQVNPAHAFEWADNAVLAAAKLQRVIWFLSSACDEQSPLPFNQIDDGLNYAVDQATRCLLDNSHRGASTSHMSNAMDAAKREACSWFVRCFSKHVA